MEGYKHKPANRKRLRTGRWCTLMSIGKARRFVTGVYLTACRLLNTHFLSVFWSLEGEGLCSKEGSFEDGLTIRRFIFSCCVKRGSNGGGLQVFIETKGGRGLRIRRCVHAIYSTTTKVCCLNRSMSAAGISLFNVM